VACSASFLGKGGAEQNEYKARGRVKRSSNLADCGSDYLDDVYARAKVRLRMSRLKG